MLRPRTQGLLLASFCTLIWGFQYPVGRIVLGEAATLSPIVGAFYKFLFATVGMLPFALFAAPPATFARAIREDFPGLFRAALFGVFAEGFLALYSVKYTTAARSSLLCNMSPLFTVILAAIVARRWPGKITIFGLAVGILGSYLIFLSSASDIYSGGNATTLPGDLLALASGLAWAYFTIACAPLGKKHGALPCTVIMLAFSTLFLLIWCICTGTPFLIPLPRTAWLGLLFLGTLATGICVGLWNAAAMRLSPDAIGAFGYGSAAIGMLSGIFGLKETISWRFALAVACCMFAVWLMNTYADTENH